MHRSVGWFSGSEALCHVPWSADFITNMSESELLAHTGLRDKLQAFYSEIGRPSIDPELMLRMLIVAYCYGIRSERKLCEEVELHLAYRWFCRLDLDDRVPDHSTFSAP